MKRILITSNNSYIGNSFEKYLSNLPDRYAIEKLSVRDDSWKSIDFSKYHVIFHVAGLVHKRDNKVSSDMYYSINRDLTIEIAKKAKMDGVGQFIFMSSVSVYGLNKGIITKNTVPMPNTDYGKSKYEAEIEISKYQCSSFNVCILRVPMVYGKDCKGNFQSIVKLATKMRVFPKVSNYRSSIYIDNLCSFVQLLIDGDFKGIYWPQNDDYMNTSAMASWISQQLRKKLYLSTLIGVAVRIMFPISSMAIKAFGSLCCIDTEDFDFSYCKVGLEESVRCSV